MSPNPLETELLRELSRNPTPERRAEIRRRLEQHIAKVKAVEAPTTQRLRVGETMIEVIGVPAALKGGKAYFDAETAKRVALLVASKLIELGNTTGPAFAYMRKAADLRAVDVASLLNLRPETISAWETGKSTVDRAAWAWLAAVIATQSGAPVDPIGSLRTAMEPKTDKHVTIRVAA